MPFKYITLCLTLAVKTKKYWLQSIQSFARSFKTILLQVLSSFLFLNKYLAKILIHFNSYNISFWELCIISLYTNIQLTIDREQTKTIAHYRSFSASKPYLARMPRSDASWPTFFHVFRVPLKFQSGLQFIKWCWGATKKNAIKSWKPQACEVSICCVLNKSPDVAHEWNFKFK